MNNDFPQAACCLKASYSINLFHGDFVDLPIRYTLTLPIWRNSFQMMIKIIEQYFIIN